MSTLAEILFAAFLLAHGLIHASFLAPEPAAAAAGGPPWPFHLDRSWLLRRLPLQVGTVERAGRVVVGLVVVSFAAAALGVLLSAGWAAGAIVVAAVASLVQLAVWFHWWLPLGLVIDVALIVAVLGRWELVSFLGL